jgi:secreted trypsin-like serine protease
VGCPSADYPDVYTDVAYYKDWIERQIRKGKEEL